MNALRAKFEKRFPGDLRIAADLTLPLGRFSVTALFGPSGCGKTTVLRCLAGLEHPESGQIQAGPLTWLDTAKSICWRPQQRDIGYLFQEYALFPHLTVAQNIAFGIGDGSRTQRATRVVELLSRFQLQSLGDRYPHQISGGQQQRVALARVLIRQPKLLLLDEPLSALDAPSRDHVRLELRRMLAAFGIPVLLVTHDRAEAMSLADRLVIIDQGRILQQDTPDRVYQAPSDVTVARIMGFETIVPATVVSRDATTVHLMVQNVSLKATSNSELKTTQLWLAIRAENVSVRRPGETSNLSERVGDNLVSGRIVDFVVEGPLVRVNVDCGFALTSLLTRRDWEQAGVRPGDSVIASIAMENLHLIDSVAS